MKKTNISKIVFVILVVLTIGFIFSNSLSDMPRSKAESEAVTEVIRPAVETVVGKGNVTDNLIRKIAHFVEFAVLGVMLELLFKKFSFAPLFIAMTVSLTDETIQVFTGRGSQVLDVWLDFAGAAIGFFVCMIAYTICKETRNRKALK